jgi:hypothetical protein
MYDEVSLEVSGKEEGNWLCMWAYLTVCDYKIEYCKNYTYKQKSANSPCKMSQSDRVARKGNMDDQ